MSLTEELEQFDKDMQELIRQGILNERTVEEIAEEIRVAHRVRYMDILSRHYDKKVLV